MSYHLKSEDKKNVRPKPNTTNHYFCFPEPLIDYRLYFPNNDCHPSFRTTAQPNQLPWRGHAFPSLLPNYYSTCSMWISCT